MKSWATGLRLRLFRVSTPTGRRVVGNSTRSAAAQQCLQSLPALARSGRRAARLLVEAPRGPPELRQPYMRLILDSVTIDHHDVRLEGPPVVLEKLLQTGASKSLPEVLSFAQEWRAGVVKGENWTATMAFQGDGLIPSGSTNQIKGLAPPRDRSQRYA